MTKRPLIWAFLPLFLGVFWVALGSAPARAAVVYSTDFENFEIAPLNGQFGWWEDPSTDVAAIQTSYAYSGVKGLRGLFWYGGLFGRSFGQTISQGYLQFALYGLSDWNQWSEINIGGTLTYLRKDGLYQVPVYGTKICDLPSESWTQISIEWNGQDYRAKCSETEEWSGWLPAAASINPTQIDFVAGGSPVRYVIDDFKIGTGSLPPPRTDTISITQPVDESIIADFESWQVDYQFFSGNVNSTNTEDLRIAVRAAATSSANAIGWYSDWYSVFNVPDNSTSVRTLTIPKANVLLSNHQWWAWANLYYWADPEPLASSAEISFYVSTSTRAWPYPGTTTAETLGLQCAAYDFPVNQLCNAAEWLIVPQKSDLDVFNSVRDEFALKAPIGYFTAAKDIIATLKNGTPTIQIAVLGGIMDPFIAGLIWVLWLLFLFWLFKRISNLDI